jgi:hypothetical protein
MYSRIPIRFTERAFGPSVFRGDARALLMEGDNVFGYANAGLNVWGICEISNWEEGDAPHMRYAWRRS